MTQENKQLLLQDLCARLYYDVICQIYDPQQCYGEDIFDARLIQIDAWTSHCYFWGCSETDPYKIEQVKPYLRSMSSMTDDEREDWYRQSKVDYDCEFKPEPTLSLEHCHLSIDWLNKYGFDYRGLIPMGLALEAPEGMYEK